MKFPGGWGVNNDQKRRTWLMHSHYGTNSAVGPKVLFRHLPKWAINNMWILKCLWQYQICLICIWLYPICSRTNTSTFLEMWLQSDESQKKKKIVSYLSEKWEIKTYFWNSLIHLNLWYSWLILDKRRLITVNQYVHWF